MIVYPYVNPIPGACWSFEAESLPARYRRAGDRRLGDEKQISSICACGYGINERTIFSGVIALDD